VIIIYGCIKREIIEIFWGVREIKESFMTDCSDLRIILFYSYVLIKILF